MKALDMVRSPKGGWLVTVFCDGCQASATVDDSDMPGGRAGWLALNAALERSGWATSARSLSTPYPSWLCSACNPRQQAPAAAQLALFAADAR